MKILAIVGSNAENSYNRKLLFVMKERSTKHDIELAEIEGLSLYKESRGTPQVVGDLTERIETADLVLAGSPEQQHSVTSALKSALEWLSSNLYPSKGKPVFIMGTSPLARGSGRSQTRSENILAAPGFSYLVFNEDEFILDLASQVLDEDSSIKDERALEFLDRFFGEAEEWYEQITR